MRAYSTEGLELARTWYLLVELNGTSQDFLLRARYSLTLPIDSSTHLSSADSDASPLHSLSTHTVASLTSLLTHVQIPLDGPGWIFSLVGSGHVVPKFHYKDPTRPDPRTAGVSDKSADFV